MTFINAGALIALAAAAIPILIHLFSRQRHRDIEFSTLKFLKKLENKRLRRLKIAELILLLLRILAIACITFAFARPAVQHFGGGENTGASVCAVILIDNSLPTQSRSPEGTLFAEGRKIALNLLQVFEPGDEIHLQTSSVLNEKFSLKLNDESIDKLRKKSFQLSPVEGAPDWQKSFEYILRVFQSSQYANRELYIISPLYKQFSTSEKESLERIASENARIFYLETGPDYQKNAAISNVNLKTEIVQPGLPVIVEVEVTNHSNEKLENIPLSLFVGNDRIASNSTTIPAGEKILTELKFVPETPGYFSGTARLDYDDALTADNRVYFSLYIPPVLEAYLAGDSLETAIVKLALNPGGKSGSSVKIVELRSVNRLVDHPDAMVVFLAGIEKIDSFSAGLLKSVLIRGGGVILSPSQSSSLAEINRNFLKNLNLPQFGEIVLNSSTWGTTDLEHPVFNGVFSDKIEIDSPVFERYITLTGEMKNSVIDFRNGDNFLSEFPAESGKVIVFTSGFSEWWSDISHRGIFVPLINRISQYAGSNVSDQFRSIISGGEIEHYAEPSNSIFTVKRPDGLKIEVIPEQGMSTIKLNYVDTGKSGIYTVMLENDTSAVFAVNPAAEYSSLHRIEEADIDGAVKIEVKSDMRQTVFSARIGTELWKIFLIFGLCLLLIEGVLTRLISMK